jgi:catechol 2,3-dioxygenase-like lactoylglutathione lyase family enzyme
MWPALRIADSVDFYTRVLDFECSASPAELQDPGFAVLTREGDELFLSSHGGDGEFGQAVVVIVPDIDRLFERLKQRGLKIPITGGASPVHEGPVDQTWGTREFYVDDPDSNTLRFVQR